MQITLTVPDTKADSFLDVLRHISYVEVQQSDTFYDEPSASEDEFDEDDDEDEEEFYSEEPYTIYREDHNPCGHLPTIRVKKELFPATSNMGR